jgi:hypothetical protein
MIQWHGGIDGFAAFRSHPNVATLFSDLCHPIYPRDGVSCRSDANG